MSIKQRLGNFLFRIAKKLNKGICIEKSDYYSKDGKIEIGMNQHVIINNLKINK